MNKIKTGTVKMLENGDMVFASDLGNGTFEVSFVFDHFHADFVDDENTIVVNGNELFDIPDNCYTRRFHDGRHVNVYDGLFI